MILGFCVFCGSDRNVAPAVVMPQLAQVSACESCREVMTYGSNVRSRIERAKGAVRGFIEQQRELTHLDPTYDAIAEHLNGLGHRTVMNCLWSRASVYRLVREMLRDGPQVTSEEVPIPTW